MLKKSNRFLFIPILLIIIICINITAVGGHAKQNSQLVLSEQKVKQIENFIQKQMNNSKIPGMSVVICDNTHAVFNKQYGYADKERKKKVTETTYFELGSNSKAFTGLAVTKLVQEGKISLSDSVTQYIPWLKMKYKEDNLYYDITLEQLLHHTSGIPFNSIGYIEADASEDALENTVRKLLEQKLDNIPGTEYSYATINYDILGLVIEKVAQMSYEEYMYSNIFKTLGLNHTCFLYDTSVELDIASGYKLSFLGIKKYSAPVYRGNAPAGYISMNSKDLIKWLQLNMDDANCSDDIKEWIDLAHEANRTVDPDSTNLSSYAAGWNVYQTSNGKIAHGGNNPNYSSYMIVCTQSNLAVGVLANLNSECTTMIANGILDIIEDKDSNYEYKDQYKTADIILTIFVIISIFLTIFTLFLLYNLVLDILKKKRTFTKNIKRVLIRDLLLLGFSCIGIYCIYQLPFVLYSGLTWDFLLVWGPFSLKPACILGMISVIILFLYFNIVTFFPKKQDKYIFLLTILSIVSGLGNSIIIFTVNEALNRTSDQASTLFMYCLFGMILYVFGQRIVRNKMIDIANHYVYNMRMNIVNGLLASPYTQFEQLSNGNINAIINGDIQVMSNSPNIIVSLITNLGTLICCYVYLAVLNKKLLLCSTIVIIFAVVVYLLTGKNNGILWEQTRSLQDIFYDYVNDLILGFKQLKMNFLKSKEFKEDIEVNCINYTQKNVEASKNFTTVFVIGELVFTIVIMSVAFLFPVLFPYVTSSTLKTYVFVFLFMAGPLSGVMNSVPELIKTNISLKRIKEFQSNLQKYSEAAVEEKVNVIDKNKEVLIEVLNVEYQYKNDIDKSFKIGPMNCEFRSGEITFITGGNGSGKTTFLKLLSGLYQPDKGEIRLNGHVLKEKIGEIYSNVFSDFYLFKKLYGINSDEKQTEINELLELLQISEKLKVENGELSTLNLSTGQKKRVALMISYLENKPVYIFDEWAADQDPQFRKLFYEKLLINLRNQGKCVIAITHDDRYFHLADKLIKMDFGTLVEYKSQSDNKKGKKTK